VNSTEKFLTLYTSVLLHNAITYNIKTDQFLLQCMYICVYIICASSLVKTVNILIVHTSKVLRNVYSLTEKLMVNFSIELFTKGLPHTKIKEGLSRRKVI
jgi:hypothetical protein